MQTQDTGARKIPCNLILENRAKLLISGVLDIDEFSDKGLSVLTTGGMLHITGSELKMETLSVESGDAILFGRIDALVFSDDAREKKSFWQRVIS